MIAAGLHAYFEEYLTETERLLANNDDQRGFYKHLKSAVGLEGIKARSEHFIGDEDGTLLRDKVRTVVNDGRASTTNVFEREIDETRHHDHRPLATATA